MGLTSLHPTAPAVVAVVTAIGQRRFPKTSANVANLVKVAGDCLLVLNCYSSW